MTSSNVTAEELLGTQELSEEEVDAGILVEVSGPFATMLMALEKVADTPAEGCSESWLCTELGVSAVYVRKAVNFVNTHYSSVMVEVRDEGTNVALEVEWGSKDILDILDRHPGDLFYVGYFWALDGALIPLENGATFSERKTEIKVEIQTKEVPVEVIKEVPKPFPIEVGKAISKPRRKKRTRQPSRPKQTKADELAGIVWPDYPKIPPEMEHFITPSWYDELRKAVIAGEHVSLQGPWGVGKSTAVMQIAAELKIPIAKVGGQGQLKERALTGSPLVKDATSLFMVADFATVAIHGGIGFITEANMIDPDSGAILNGIVDSPNAIQLRGKSYDVADDFVLIVDMNPHVHGGKIMAESTRDRFWPIEVPYPDEDMLMAMLIQHGLGEETQLKTVIKIAQTIWEQQETGEIATYQLSPRRLLKAARVITDGKSVRDALKLSILPLVDSPFDRETIKELINNTVVAGIQEIKS